MVEFTYRKEKSGLLGDILRPVAQLEIKSEKTDWFPVIMYIDSGADISLVPRNFGLLLNLDLTENLGQIRGIGEAIVPLSLQEAKQVLSAGFEYVTQKDGIMLFRRPKRFR